MKKSQWIKRIKQACIDADTYESHFDSVISSLASILETRDIAQKQFEETGCKTVIEHTNKNGAVNVVKNPALTALLDCDAHALAYWRDLGLTPAGYKKLNGAQKQTKGGGLEGLLAKIEL